MAQPQKSAARIASPRPNPSGGGCKERGGRATRGCADPPNRAGLPKPPGPTAVPSRGKRPLDGCHGDRAGCAGASAQARAATPGLAARRRGDPAWTSRDARGPERGPTPASPPLPLRAPARGGLRRLRLDAAPRRRRARPGAVLGGSRDTCEHPGERGE